VCRGIIDLWNQAEIQAEKDGKAPHQHTLLYFKHHLKKEKEALPLLEMIRASIETFATNSQWLYIGTGYNDGFLTRYEKQVGTPLYKSMHGFGMNTSE
jgi:hypothetical protein